MRIFILYYLLCTALKPVIVMPPVGVQDWCRGAKRLFLFVDSELNKLQVVCPLMREEIFGLVLNSALGKLSKLNV